MLDVFFTQNFSCMFLIPVMSVSQRLGILPHFCKFLATVAPCIKSVTFNNNDNNNITNNNDNK